MKGGPCRWRPHTWGRWLPLRLETEFGPNDTQYRTCERCGREQLKAWWRR